MPKWGISVSIWAVLNWPAPPVCGHTAPIRQGCRAPRHGCESRLPRPASRWSYVLLEHGPRYPACQSPASGNIQSQLYVLFMHPVYLSCMSSTFLIYIDISIFYICGLQKLQSNKHLQISLSSDIFFY